MSRVHLLRMTAGTQKTVDLAVKAYQLNSLEFSREVQESAKKLHEIELGIADRGRSLLDAGKLIDATTRSACSSLRIYSALRIAHAAAIEMTRNTRLKIAKKHLLTPAATVQMADFVNRLIRLSTVAVFNRDTDHAATVLRLEERRRKSRVARGSVDEDLEELAVFRCLEQIAEQAYEIADAVAHLRPASQGLPLLGSHDRLLSQAQCFDRLP